MPKILSNLNDMSTDQSEVMLVDNNMCEDAGVYQLEIDLVKEHGRQKEEKV